MHSTSDMRRDLPKEKDTQRVPALRERKDRGLRSCYCPAVVEQTEDIDGMQSLAERDQQQDPVWHTTRLLVDGGSQGQGDQVQRTVDLLAFPEVAS